MYCMTGNVVCDELSQQRVNMYTQTQVDENGHTEFEVAAYKIDSFSGTFLIPYTIMFRLHMIIDLA